MPMLNLQFLGRGAAFYPAFGNTNAFFTSQQDLFFLDFGESNFAKVERLFDLKRYRRVYVLLTHLHADHSGSLASLISYCYCVLKFKVYVVHPIPTVVELLRLQGIADFFYHYLPALPEECSVTAEPVEVRHAEDMRSFGYLLSDGEERIYYSGDAYEMPDCVADALSAGVLTRVYHDVSSKESEAHCYVQRLEAAVPPPLWSLVYAMHLDCDCIADLRHLGFSVVEVMQATEIEE